MIYDTDKTDELHHVMNMYLTVNISSWNLACTVKRVYWRASPSFMEIMQLVLCFHSIIVKLIGQTLYFVTVSSLNSNQVFLKLFLHFSLKLAKCFIWNLTFYFEKSSGSRRKSLFSLIFWNIWVDRRLPPQDFQKDERLKTQPEIWDFPFSRGFKTTRKKWDRFRNSVNIFLVLEW